MVVRIKCVHTVPKWRPVREYEKTSHILLRPQTWILNRGLCHPCHFLSFFPKKPVLHSLQREFSTLAADWNPRRAFQTEDLFTVTVHWWVGRQSCLVGSSTWPWVAGPCVLQEARYLGTERHQKGSTQNTGSVMFQRRVKGRNSIEYTGKNVNAS